MATTYLWPANGQLARGQSMTAFGANVVVGDALACLGWQFSATASLGPITFSATDNGSIVGVATDMSGNLWALSSTSNLYEYNGTTITSGSVGSGFATDVVATTGGIYCLNDSGVVTDASGNVKMTFVAPTDQLTYANGDFITFGASGMGVALAPSGTPYYVALPAALSTVTCSAPVSAYLAAGGYAAAMLGSGYLAMALDPAAIQVVGVASGLATVYQAATTGTNTWTPVATLTGLTATPVSCDWSLNGNQVFISDTTAGVIKILNYSAGTLTLAQTLTLSGTGQLTIVDNTHGLVCTGSKVTALLSTGGTWAVNTGNAFTLANAFAILQTGPASAIASTTSGVVYFSLVASTWSIASTAALTFTPTNFAQDNSGAIYAVASGNFACISGGVTSYGTLDGAAQAVAAFNAQAVVMEYPTSAQLHVIGNATSGWTQQSSVTTIASGAGLLMANETLFAFGAANTALFNFGTPYTIIPVRAGAVSFYNFSTSGWTSVVLGNDHVPSAICATATGTAKVATYQNDLYTVSLTGAVSGTIPLYGVQLAGTPLGVSSILLSGTTTYLATVLAGAVVVLS